MLAAFWAWVRFSSHLSQYPELTHKAQAVPFVAIALLYLERPWTSIEGVDDQIKDFFNFCVQLAFLLHICSIVTWIPTTVLCHRNSKTEGTSSISNYFYSLWSNVLGLTIVIDAVLLFSAWMVLSPELLATILFLALVSIVCWMCT